MKTFLIIYAISVIFSLFTFSLFNLSTGLTIKRLKKENKLPNDSNMTKFEAFTKIALLSLYSLIPLFNILITIGIIFKGPDYVKKELEEKERKVG